jgi:hypothetical protein
MTTHRDEDKWEGDNIQLGEMEGRRGKQIKSIK